MIFNDDLPRIYGEMAWYLWIFMVLMNIPHPGGWYPLVICYIAMEKSPFFMGKSTINGHFQSFFVCLPGRLLQLGVMGQVRSLRLPGLLSEFPHRQPHSQGTTGNHREPPCVKHGEPASALDEFL